VGIIRRGRLVRVAELDELHEIRSYQVEIEFGAMPPAAQLRTATGVEQVEVDGNRVTCTVRGSFDSFLAAIAGHPVLKLVSHEPSLEEIFLTYYQEHPVQERPVESGQVEGSRAR
jgi:ABC-2 type transport system ATP-binding protein